MSPALPAPPPATGATVDVDRETGIATWRALGTYVHLRVADPGMAGDAARLAVDVLDEVDRTCSRFRDDSELVALSARPGRHTVSPVLAGAITVALEAAAETDGIVDPTLGPLLVAGGYDRTFDLVPGAVSTPATLPRTRADWRGIVVDGDTVTVPEGVSLDLGATGKAFAADLVALVVSERLSTGVLVSIGGDVRVVPDPAAVAGPAAEPWPVRIGHTRADLDAGRGLATVRLRTGGLATSSVTARRWVRGGSQWHHLLDPRTGRPARGPWATVTALGHTCAAANTASTAAIVLGDAAYDWLLSHDVAALLATADGTLVRTPAWRNAGIDLAPAPLGA